MTDALFEDLVAARRDRTPCALATVAETKGSVPRAAGAKMLIYADGKISGTIGGGKFEALVIADAQASMRDGQARLKSYPLHEGDPASFGAICGGESTVLIEPQNLNTAIFLIGGGHCSRAIARLALECGMHVTVVEDRADAAGNFPPAANCVTAAATAFIAGRAWQPTEVLLLVSRNHQLDQDALAVALRTGGAGYVGMIGSRKKVRQVFEALRAEGITDEQLARVYAPLGLDIGADSPGEIAISVLAEVLKVTRGASGYSLSSMTHAREPRSQRIESFSLAPVATVPACHPEAAKTLRDLPLAPRHA
ncbi:MAG: XdhC family protein [Chthoniobacterales bacterium]